MRLDTSHNRLEAEINRARLESIELQLRLDSKILNSERNSSRITGGPGTLGSATNPGIEVHEGSVDSYLGCSRWMSQSMDREVSSVDGYTLFASNILLSQSLKAHSSPRDRRK